MTATISVRLDKELLRDLTKVKKNWQADRSEVVRRLLADAVRSWKLQNAIEMLRQRKISIGKAAEECGVSVWDMLEFAKEKNVNWTGYSREDLERDLRAYVEKN